MDSDLNRVAVIALTGLPGSGKSTLGRQLARRMDLDFVDSDRFIEQRFGCSVSSIFERNGEDHFRDIEEAALEELTAGDTSLVLATGGGVVLRKNNRVRLLERTFAIYLHTQAGQIFRRLRYDKSRPLLQVSDPLARLQGMYAERDPLYREASHFVLDMERLSSGAVMDIIGVQYGLRRC